MEANDKILKLSRSTRERQSKSARERNHRGENYQGVHDDYHRNSKTIFWILKRNK